MDPENSREGTPPSPMPQVTACIEYDEDGDEVEDDDEVEDNYEVGLSTEETPQTNLSW